MIPTFKLTVTDEFNCEFVFVTEDKEDLLDRVALWLAQLYEGPSQEVKLGANGPTYSNGGGIEGGFTWVSPKYKGNAGKKVGIGLDNDDVVNIISKYGKSTKRDSNTELGMMGLGFKAC